MSSIEELELLRRENKMFREELNDLERDYSEVCKEHSDAILRAAQAEKYAENLAKDLMDSQRNFEVVDDHLTEVLIELDALSMQVLGREFDGLTTFEGLSESFSVLDGDIIKFNREISRLEGEIEAMNEELREMEGALTDSYGFAMYEEIIEDLTEEKRLLHKEIARLNEELAVAIGVKDDDYAEEYRKMTVEFAKEHREVRELRGLLSDIHRLSDIEV